MPFFRRNKDKVSKNDSSITLEDFTTNATNLEVENTDKPVLSRSEKNKRSLPMRTKKEEVDPETTNNKSEQTNNKVRVSFSEKYDETGKIVPLASVYYTDDETLSPQPLNQVVAETRPSITPSMKLARLLIKKYVEDKLYPNHSQITTGSIIAGIKFIDYQVKELFGEGLTRDDHQILLSTAVTEASLKGIGVKPINIQTKGKVYKTRAIIKNLKKMSREDLIELLGE